MRRPLKAFAIRFRWHPTTKSPTRERMRSASALTPSQWRSRKRKPFTTAWTRAALSCSARRRPRKSCQLCKHRRRPRAPRKVRKWNTWTWIRHARKCSRRVCCPRA
eukprot:scaffold1397_cov254-Pinguiococcus_pyrenoidosus.AAC.70